MASRVIMMPRCGRQVHTPGPSATDSVAQRTILHARMPHRRAAWLAAIALMAVLGSAWLSYQSYRFFADPGTLWGRRIAEGAIDLGQRYGETQAWFQGEPVYGSIGTAVYPPATYAILALPLYAMPWPAVKALWFAASVAATAGLSTLLLRQSMAVSWHERAFIAVMPFAIYATGAALGNGQLVLFVLPCVIAALLMLTGPALPRRELVIGSLLMTVSLMQPTIAAPFFWIVMFKSPRMRAATIVVVWYLALTAVALYFQMSVSPRISGEADPLGVISAWTGRAQAGSSFGSTSGGYGTVHNLLAELGIPRWNWPVSLALLLLVGAWIFRHRRADIWLLIGVTAVVARIWTYHRWYDDLLLILPLVTLFRLARMPATGARARTIASALFVWIWAFLLAPGVRYAVPSPGILIGVQIAGWLAALAFLAWITEVERRRIAAACSLSDREGVLGLR